MSKKITRKFLQIEYDEELELPLINTFKAICAYRGETQKSIIHKLISQFNSNNKSELFADNNTEINILKIGDLNEK